MVQCLQLDVINKNTHQSRIKSQGKLSARKIGSGDIVDADEHPTHAAARCHFQLADLHQID